MTSMSSMAMAVRADGLQALPSLQSKLRVRGPQNLAVRGGRIRCESNNPVREAVDRVSKVEVTREAIERNQETNESEKKSVMGTEPSSSGSFYPRPELERRPETGSRSFGSVFAFDGAAPETINGRLAMLGLVWTVAAEQMTGNTVMQQLTAPGQTGLLYFLAVVQILTYASLVPIMSGGESSDARRLGPFTATAERWNGRMAMVGFFSLLVVEMFTHTALFG
jgi:hypothetical protein